MIQNDVDKVLRDQKAQRGFRVAVADVNLVPGAQEGVRLELK